MGVEAFLIGPHIVGVRSDDDGVLAELTTVLHAHHRPGVPAYANLSVMRGEVQGGVRAIPLLFRGGQQVARSSNLGRILRATIAHLDAFLPPPDELLATEARAVVNRDRAVLVTLAFADAVDVAGRRIARDGWSIVDGAAAFVDRTTLELVVPEIRLELDHDALARLDARHPRGTEELPTRGIRRPVRALVSLDTADEDLSPAQRFSRLAAFVSSPRRPLRATDLRTLASMQADAQVIRSGWIDERSLPQVLRRLG